MYNCASSLVLFENKNISNIYLYLEKRTSLLSRRCRCKFISRRIGSYVIVLSSCRSTARADWHCCILQSSVEEQFTKPISLWSKQTSDFVFIVHVWQSRVECLQWRSPAGNEKSTLHECLQCSVCLHYTEKFIFMIRSLSLLLLCTFFCWLALASCDSLLCT
jgi:hypothetical protein